MFLSYVGRLAKVYNTKYLMRIKMFAGTTVFPDVYIYHVSDMTNVWNIASIFMHLPWMILPMDILFFNNGFDDIQWASFISDWHAKLRIIGRRVPGFATGSPCGGWGCEWTTCLLYDGPLLSLCFLEWHLMCYDGIVSACLYITQILPIIVPFYIFYSEITFYIEYFVLPYSIDVVSTLFY